MAASSDAFVTVSTIDPSGAFRLHLHSPVDREITVYKLLQRGPIWRGLLPSHSINRTKYRLGGQKLPINCHAELVPQASRERALGWVTLMASSVGRFSLQVITCLPVLLRAWMSIWPSWRSMTRFSCSKTIAIFSPILLILSVLVPVNFLKLDTVSVCLLF